MHLIGKKKSVQLFIFVMSFWAQFGQANIEDHTHVSMEGKIINASCSIVPDSKFQTVSLDDKSHKLISFHIHLTDCILQNFEQRFQNFSITFEGANDGDNFIYQASAKGIAMQIVDKAGEIARPGKALEHYSLSEDDDLYFTLRLLNKGNHIKNGDYWNVVGFRLSYF